MACPSVERKNLADVCTLRLLNYLRTCILEQVYFIILLKVCTTDEL